MPLFVLLEHRWNGLHYDLMLETEPGGCLRTWAIDEEVVAGKNLQARELPAHRAIYLDYEGEVSGGRGRVKRLDRGEYEPRQWAEDVIRVRLAGDQLVGEIELRRAWEGSPTPAWSFRLGNLD